MSLRARLVLILLGLLVLGVGLALGGTFGAIQDWRGDRTHEQLRQTGRTLQANLLARGGSPPRIEVTSDDLGAVWRDAAGLGEVPSFFQVRGPDGRPEQTVDFGPVPAVPLRLPEQMLPDPPQPDNPDGERFTVVDTVLPDGRSDEARWLVRTSRLGDSGDVLLLATPTAATDELAGRAARGAITSAVLALLAVTALSLWAVRRGLRPLADIADTAAAIGAGDLSRRVGHTDPGTEIGQLGTALNTMLGQLETAFRAREASEERLRRFVADASHELRTPLATIRGYAELFHRGAATRPADLATAMHRIEAEAVRMTGLVDELLLLARLDQGRPLDREPLDLAALAAETVADARVTEPTRLWTLHAAAPAWVSGDAARLRQVLANLLGNVREHTPAGSPAEVSVRTTGSDVEVAVADHGPGVVAAHRDRIFERFYRADAGRSGGGSGLGLAIVAAVVTAHGGAYGVRETPGGGATVWLRLPCTVDPCEPGAPRPA